MEALIGGTLAFSYWYSGNNLAVPIIVHTLYDFITLLVTWNYAKDDLNKRLSIAVQDEIKALLTLNPETFKLLATRVRKPQIDITSYAKSQK